MAISSASACSVATSPPAWACASKQRPIGETGKGAPRGALFCARRGLVVLPSVGADVELAAGFLVELAHLGHAGLGLGLAHRGRGNEAVGGLVLLRGEVPDLLRDLHRA